MAKFKACLARLQPFGILNSGTPIRFEQDRLQLDCQSLEIDDQGQPVFQSQNGRHERRQFPKRNNVMGRQILG